MDSFRSLSKSGRDKITLALFLLLPWLWLNGCAQPKPVSEIVKRSGLDREGRPIAFSVLPKSNKTGEVDWVASIRQGILNPRGSLEAVSEPPGSVLDLDILFNVSNAYPVPNVIFPHAPHTLWLQCSNCHPSIFTMRKGANPVSMDLIIKGNYCGRCHGVVAFSIADCFRCHSSPKPHHGQARMTKP